GEESSIRGLGTLTGRRCAARAVPPAARPPRWTLRRRTSRWRPPAGGSRFGSSAVGTSRRHVTAPTVTGTRHAPRHARNAPASPERPPLGRDATTASAGPWPIGFTLARWRS